MMEKPPDLESESKPVRPAKPWIFSFAAQSWRFQWFQTLFKSQPAVGDYILLIIGTVAAIAAGLPFPLLGIVFGELIDDLNSSTCESSTNKTEVMANIKARVLYIVYIAVANFVLIYLYTSCWSLFGERLVRRIRRDYFQSLVRQDAAFFDTLASGDVTSRLVTDIETVQTGTSEKVGIFIASLSYFVAAYVVAFIKASRLAGMLASLIPAYALMAILGGYYITKFSKRISVHIDAATSVAASCLTNIPLVHALGAQDRLTGLFGLHLDKTRKDVFKKTVCHSAQLGLLYFIAYSSNALAFWEGSREIASAIKGNNSGVTVGAIYTVIFVLLDASFIISQVAPFIHVFDAAGSASERLEATISRQPSIDGTVNTAVKEFSLSTDDIWFEDVSFTYPGRKDRQALKNITLQIPAKKTTAIVGASGGGKSTLTTLLERLYDPDEGRLLIGSTDFTSLSVQQLRRKIGFVEQNASLLNRSILENVAYGLLGRPTPMAQGNEPLDTHSGLSKLVELITNGTPEDQAVSVAEPEVQQMVHKVYAALQMAHASEFVQRLPVGIATNVGPSASQISGGQRQRIALARALIREPELLILDEATASLDSTSERLIQTAIREASEGRTVISIAHRLATIQDAHQIIVINGGRVIEQGSHHSLLERGGEYARMVKAQSVSSRASRSLKSNEGELSSASSSTWSLSKSTQVPGMTSPNDNDLLNRECERDQDQRPSKLGLGSLIRPYWLYISTGLVGAVIVGGSYTGEAALFGQTVGRLSACNDPRSVLRSGNLFGLLFFLLGLIEFVAMVVNGSAFGLGAAKTLFRVRVSAFRALLVQSVQWHTSNDRDPNTLLSIITSDASALSDLTGTTIGLIASTGVNMVAGIIFAHIVAWKIAIVLLATVPILLTAGAMRLRVLSQFHERHQKQFAKSASITLEVVENIRVVASLSLERTMYEEFNGTLQSAYNETLRAILHSSVWLALSFSIPNLVYALGYWWGSQQITAGTYSQIQFFTVLPALLFSTQSCSQMFALAPDISKARKAKSNVLELINSAPEARSAAGQQQVWDIEKSTRIQAASRTGLDEKGHPSSIGLSFDDVHFAYPTRPDMPVLRGLGFSVNPGQFCALAGPSGQGKSTILTLIERFYVPKKGSIVVDHSNITYQTSTSFRSLISFVPQSSVLFHGTIAFNLGLGAHPDRVANRSEIEDACRLVGVHEFIASLPNGYETIITSNSQLSGGQRQRLCIARALVRKPALLLLDESTSALDTESEQQIKESLVRVRREMGITILAIAHRLNTIMEADRIFWIEGGVCEYSGRHDELMESCPAYRECVEHQML